MELLKSSLDAILDSSSSELIGAIMIGLALALGMSGIYQLLRRGAGEPPMLMVVSMLLAILPGMALVAGHEQSRAPKWEPQSQAVRPDKPSHPGPGDPAPAGSPPSPPPGGFSPIGPPAWQIIAAADADKDGRLTPEEAARFIRSSDRGKDGAADAREIDAALEPAKGPGRNPHPPRLATGLPRS